MIGLRSRAPAAVVHQLTEIKYDPLLDNISSRGEFVKSLDQMSHRMEHLARPPTSSGGRNMQDTTFSISAEYPSN